jgi:Ni/Co efflux regulator RcnB
MKKALIISGFLLALSVTGCSTPQPAAPVAQPDDAARRDADRARDAERDKDRDRERDQKRDADHDRQACPDGEHLFTDRDGKTGCVRN